MPELWGHTWLGWLNFLIFQWLGLRFCEEVTVPEGKHLYWHFVKERPMRGWS